MKKLRFFIIASAAVLTSYPMFGQWTGTSPSPLYTTTQSVGIGTSSPGAALNVATTGALPFFVQRTTGQTNGLKLYFTSSPATGISVASGSSIFQNSATSSDILFMTTPTLFSTVMKADGKVGIGTTSPATSLTIQSSVSNDGVRVIQTGTSAASLGLFNSGSGGRNWGLFSFGSANPQGAGNFSIYDYTAGADRLFIDGSTGNVGIGTIAPSTLLTVNGNVLIGDPTVATLPTGYKLYVETGILTEKVKVAVENTTNWSDYVFEKNYHLQNLNKLEEYVTSNKHLPNIPSAEQVVKEGVDLGEMTSKLLGKVEELTLYIIEQNKKIETLQNQVNVLQKN